MEMKKRKFLKTSEIDFLSKQKLEKLKCKKDNM